SRHILRLFFGLIAAVEAFGAVLVEPDHNPMKLDHGTPSVSGLTLVFGFGFAFDHAQPPRSKSGSLAMFDAMRLALTCTAQRYYSFQLRFVIQPIYFIRRVQWTAKHLNCCLMPIFVGKCAPSDHCFMQRGAFDRTTGMSQDRPL